MWPEQHILRRPAQNGYTQRGLGFNWSISAVIWDQSSPACSWESWVRTEARGAPGRAAVGPQGGTGGFVYVSGRAASFTTPRKLKLTASSHVRTEINGDVYTITQMRA